MKIKFLSKKRKFLFKCSKSSLINKKSSKSLIKINRFDCFKQSSPSLYCFYIKPNSSNKNVNYYKNNGKLLITNFSRKKNDDKMNYEIILNDNGSSSNNNNNNSNNNKKELDEEREKKLSVVRKNNKKNNLLISLDSSSTTTSKEGEEEEEEEEEEDDEVLEEQEEESSMSTTTITLPKEVENIINNNNKNKSNEFEDDLGEEEIIDGFAILTFKYLKDLKREYENRKRKHDCFTHSNDKFNLVSSSSYSSSSTNDSSSVISSSSSSSSANRKKYNKLNRNDQSNQLIRSEIVGAAIQTSSTALTKDDAEELKTEEKTSNKVDVIENNKENIEMMNKDVNNVTPNVINENDLNKQQQEINLLSSPTSSYSSKTVNDRPSSTTIAENNNELSSVKPGVDNLAKITTYNPSLSPLFNLPSLYAHQQHQQQQQQQSIFPQSLHRPPASSNLNTKNEEPIINFDKFILDFYNQQIPKSPLFTTPLPPPLPLSLQQLQQQQQLNTANKINNFNETSTKVSSHQSSNHKSQHSSNDNFITQQQLQQQPAPLAINNKNNKNPSSSHQQNSTSFKNETQQPLVKLENLSNNNHNDRLSIIGNANSSNIDSNNNNVNKQQQQQQLHKVNSINNEYPAYLQNSNNLKSAKNSAYSNNSSIPPQPINNNSNNNLFSSSPTQYQHPDSIAQHQQLLLNSYVNHFKETQKVQQHHTSDINSNNNKQQKSKPQQQQQPMFVASNKSSSNPLESYTPDLLQRELNSRFLQTANNYTENKPNKIGTTATTNAPPLLQPYLNLNKNEATNLYASQSIFNPMNEANKLLQKPMNMPFVNQYFGHNILAQQPPPPTTPPTTPIPENTNRTTAASQLVSPFINPPSLQQQQQAFNLQNNAKLLPNFSLQKKPKSGKWCSAHIKIAYMILEDQKRKLNKPPHESYQKESETKHQNEKHSNLHSTLNIAPPPLAPIISAPTTYFPPLYNQSRIDYSNPTQYLSNSLITSDPSFNKQLLATNPFGGLSNVISNPPSSMPLNSTSIGIPTLSSSLINDKNLKRSHSSSNSSHHHSSKNNDPKYETHNNNNNNNPSHHHHHHHHHERHKNVQQNHDKSRSRSRSPLNRHNSGGNNITANPHLHQHHHHHHHHQHQHQSKLKEESQANLLSSNNYSKNPKGGVDLYEKYRNDFLNINQMQSLNNLKQQSNPSAALLNHNPLINNSLPTLPQDILMYSKTKEANDKIRELEQQQQQQWAAALTRSSSSNSYPYSQMQNFLTNHLTPNDLVAPKQQSLVNNARLNEAYRLQLANEPLSSMHRHMDFMDREPSSSSSSSSLMRNGGLNFPNSTYFESTNPNNLVNQFPLSYQGLNIPHLPPSTPPFNNNQLNMNKLLNKQNENNKQQLMANMEFINHQNASAIMKKNASSSKLKQNSDMMTRNTSPLPSLNYEGLVSKKLNNNNNNEVIIIKDDSNERSQTPSNSNEATDKYKQHHHNERIQMMQQQHHHNVQKQLIIEAKNAQMRSKSNNLPINNNNQNIT